MKNYGIIFALSLLLAACGGGGDSGGVASSYTVGGNVSGLSGTVILANNGGDDLTVTANGNFTFATEVAEGSTYNVQIRTQPVGQTCSAGNNTGTVTGANVTGVVITCSTNTYSVGGTVSGLSGTVILTNNGGDDLTVSTDGSFTFATEVADGGAYNVQVKTQPVGQTCSAGNNTGTMLGAAITSVAVTCSTNTSTVGGNVSGLSGTVILTNNGGDDLTVNADGGFTFATEVAHGSTYNVQVKTQPTGQTCSAGNNTGTMLGAAITSVAVTCTTNTYSIGGDVSGLNGTVILTNNGGNDLAVSTNGSFTFTTEVANGSTYNVQVKTQPVGQTCSAGNNSGIMANANITSVTVTCSTNTFTVGGSVSGLSGAVTLTNNGGDDLAVTADGDFTFTTEVAHGATYNVQIKTQPVGQTCSAASNTGTISGVAVNTVTVTCSFDSYTVGGSVSGLSGTVVLTNNGGDDLAVTADGTFTFTTQVDHGGTYNVQVKTQPAEQTCTAGGNTGTIAGADINNVSITCASTTYPIGGTISGLNGTVVLANNGGDDLAVAANGSYTFATQMETGAAYNVTVRNKPFNENCTVSNADGSVAGGAVTNVDVFCEIFLVVVAGGDHTLAIKPDGTLWSWGRNGNGQLGLGDTADRATSTQLGSDSDWSAVSANNKYSMAIKNDGTLWAWGYNAYGQLGLGDTTQRTSPALVGADSNWITVTAGANHTLAIKTDGTLWAWGYNGQAQLGLGDTTNSSTPMQVGSDTDWAAVTAGSMHTLAVKTDSSLWGWGYNGYGQLGLGDTTNSSPPVQIGSDTDWAAIAAGSFHTLAIKTNGALWAWGQNNAGQLGLGDTTQRLSPVQVGADTDWATVAAGQTHTLAIKSSGVLWAWGDNNLGQLGLGDNTRRLSPVQVGADTDWAGVTAGYAHTAARKIDNTMLFWGDNLYGQLAQGTFGYIMTPTQAISGTTWTTAVAAGASHSVARKSDGTLWAWGKNSNGQLGLGDGTQRTSPVQVGVGADWVTVAAGYFHTLALQTDGTLWAWGSNSYGQLGLGDTTQRNSPVQVGVDIDWLTVTTGEHHTLAIKSDNTLWAWGNNGYGQLGLGDTTNINTPAQVGADTDWIAVFAGGLHTLAIKSDGTLWSWGNNSAGQLGLGDTTDSYTPAQVGADTDWAAVTAGYTHTLALKTDGALWSWGNNNFGQLGLGTATSYTTPAQVGTDADWTAMSAGSYHTLAIKSDLTLWSWGYNGFGQLGMGDTTSRLAPTQFNNDRNWAAVSAGAIANHNIGIKIDGTMLVWGKNDSDQLGLHTAWYATPMPVAE